ncbi:MAG: hypothetical protein LBQ61_07020, partial [Spirochaetales bacterium]|nr:hypothetical protein [Spirochaetales bacterium]
EKLEKLFAAAQGKLGNPGFLSGASEEVILREREKLEEFRAKIAKIGRYLGNLEQL